MSDIWLALALVGTFLAIVLVGVVIDMRFRERNRPLTILQTHVGQVTEKIDLRQEELQGSLLDRIFLPLGKGLGRRLVRLTPLNLGPRIDELLVLAGNPAGWDSERVVAMKIVGGIAGVIGGALMAPLVPMSMPFKGFVVGLFGAIGYVLPSVQVRSMANRRQYLIRRQLSDVMDLLTISVEAGLGLDAAIAQVTKNVPGPLAEEFARLSQEIQIGVSRSDAFRHLGERTNVAELNGFVLSMVQADLFGVSISNVLRAQSRELRQKRRQHAEEVAQKIPVKLLFPLIFLVLPSLFIVILGPGALKIYQQFFGS